MLLSIFGLLMLFSFSAQAQLNYHYYEIGKNYTFRSLNPDNSTETFVLTVRFDEQGRAHVSRTIEKAQSSDQVLTHAFAAKNTIGMSSFTSSSKEITVLDPQASLFEIYFDGSGTLAHSGEGVKVNCICKMGGGDSTCSASSMMSGETTITITCVPDEGCNKCKMEVEKSAKSNPLLLLEATEVIME